MWTYLSAWWEPRWEVLIRVVVLAPLSSHTSARDRTSRHVEVRSTPKSDRPNIEPADRRSERYDEPQRPTSINQAHMSGLTVGEKDDGVVWAR